MDPQNTSTQYAILIQRLYKDIEDMRLQLVAKDKEIAGLQSQLKEKNDGK
tara:strand:- start:323 stop:472 length:150 start_codon:yes stop_codon:yes gene_type:complete